MINLDNISTSDLVDAVSERKGVEHDWINVDEVVLKSIEGPARVLIVYD
ncbi:MAG: hypothetical protein M0R51_12025 [Clostridia bacterium]|jgi:hypothetical protein|nr:hypothetical protein [Clostridia bacterium]